MVLETFAGFFTKRSGTGTQAITGFGFLPKAVKISMVENTATGQKVDENYSIGYGTSSTNRGCIIHTKHAGTDLGGERSSSTSIMGIMDNVGVVLEEADLDSMDSDGITLDWTTSTTTLMKFKVEAWGGTDIEDVIVDVFELPDITGNFSITGVGFQPNFMMSINNGNLSGDEFLNKLLFAQGCALSASSRWNLSGSMKNKITKILQGGGALHSTGVWSVRKKTTQFDSEAELVTFDSDGLTGNVSDAGMDASDVIALFFDITTIADVAIGTFNKTTSGAPTDDAITSIGNDPTMVSFVTAGGAAVNAVRDNEYHPAFGCAFDTLETYASVDMRENVDDDPVVNSSLWSETKIIGLHTNANSATIDSEADFKSFDTGGFTITWTTNDANAYGVGWIAWEAIPASTPIERFVNETVERGEDIELVRDIRFIFDETVNRGEGIISARALVRLHTETVERPEDVKVPFVISGITMANDLSILPNCRVVLLKRDDVAEASRIYTVVQHTNSNGSGEYTFVILDDDSLYLVVAYDDQAEDARGVTNDDLTPKLAG